MGDMLKAALWYAEHGLFAFPIKANNKDAPLVKWGSKATTDPEQIKRWWSRWPDANVAIATKPSDLVVVDVDVKDGVPGMENWRDLVEYCGKQIEKTVIVETPSGGLHLWYKANGGVIGNKELRDGIDVRAAGGDDGGYVVAPPSKTPVGKYDFAMDASPREHEIRALPFSLGNMLKEKNRKRAEPIVGAIGKGERNNTLASLAGSMRRRGMSQVAIESALLVENERCTPPLSEQEVRGIAKSIGRYAPEDGNGSDPDKPPESLNDFHTTDTGNAEALRHIFGDKLRYDHRRARWLVWSDHRWAPDKDGRVNRFGVKTARARQKAALDAPKETRENLGKWAFSSESESRVRKMLNMARILKPIAISGDDLDEKPWLLGCANGVLDLRIGELRPGRPEDKLTKTTDLAFDPDAKAPRFERFLHEIFDGNEDLVAYIKRAVGYSLTGNCREQCLFLCWGHGWNGKTVLLNTLRRVCGDYAMNTPFSTFEAQKYGGIPNDLAALTGSRFVTAAETAETRRLNEERVKAVTGNDPVTARFMRQEFFTYTPQYKIWLAMNHKPIIKGTDEGIWRRIRLIPFTVSFKGRADRELERKLTTELPGILAWAVRGTQEWLERGLDEPKAVLVATEQYRTESDVIGQFLEDCTVEDANARVQTGELYDAYKDWCEDMGEKPLNASWFGRKMSQRGADRYRDGSNRYYLGVGLRQEGIPL